MARESWCGFERLLYTAGLSRRNSGRIQADRLALSPQTAKEKLAAYPPPLNDGLPYPLNDRTSVILELKQVWHDKPKGYCASEAKRLTKGTSEAMMHPFWPMSLSFGSMAWHILCSGRTFLERQASGQRMIKDLILCWAGREGMCTVPHSFR